MTEAPAWLKQEADRPHVLLPQTLARITETAYATPPNVFNTAHAVAFLAAAFQDCYSGLISICWLDRQGVMRYSAHQWAHKAAEQAAEWDRRHKPVGIYFRVTMLPPDWQGKRGGADDSHMFPILWADLDYGTEGHKGEGLPPTEDDARKIIAEIGEDPTYIVHSGGGLYPLYQFKRPPLITADNLTEIKDEAQQWQSVIEAASQKLGWNYGVGVGNLDRLLRLPGSTNRKTANERPCRVVDASGVLQPWE